VTGIFRKTYRVLTDAEKEHVEQIKDAAERLEALIRGTRCLRPEILGSSEELQQMRHTSLAMTNLEQAVMWAVKAAT
jgi:hypothetical protein